MASTRLIIFALCAIVIASAALLVKGCANSRSDGSVASAVKKEKVVIGGEVFHLEIAADPQTRELGLMHRDHIDKDGGMLFIFPDSEVKVQSFWMGHCLVDMDIIYLDSRGMVTATHRMKAQPPQRPDESDARYRARVPHYSSRYPAQFAIELQAGWLDRLNVRVEDRIPLDLPRLKAMAR